MSQLGSFSHIPRHLLFKIIDDLPSKNSRLNLRATCSRFHSLIPVHFSYNVSCVVIEEKHADPGAVVVTAHCLGGAQKRVPVKKSNLVEALNYLNILPIVDCLELRYSSDELLKDSVAAGLFTCNNLEGREVMGSNSGRMASSTKRETMKNFLSCLSKKLLALRIEISSAPELWDDEIIHSAGQLEQLEILGNTRPCTSVFELNRRPAKITAKSLWHLIPAVSNFEDGLITGCSSITAHDLVQLIQRTGDVTLDILYLTFIHCPKLSKTELIRLLRNAHLAFHMLEYILPSATETRLRVLTNNLLGRQYLYRKYELKVIKPTSRLERFLLFGARGRMITASSSPVF